MRKANTPLVPTSFKDAGFQFARSGETTEAIAKWILEQNPDFLENPSDEEKAALREGFALRWQDLNPAKRYNAEWVPDDKGGFEVSLAYALSYSQQAFGQLKNETPLQHQAIKGVRDKFNKYVSNNMADLKAKIRRVSAETSGKPRNPVLPYSEYLKNVMDSIKARCKTASARGDETAPDEVKLRQAIEAFYGKLK